jgi:hypothetical protein
MDAANMTETEERNLMQAALTVGYAQRDRLKSEFTTGNSRDTFGKLKALNEDIHILEQELGRVQ